MQQLDAALNLGDFGKGRPAIAQDAERGRRDTTNDYAELDDATRDEIDDIHANPIRRGLCDAPEAWASSSAADDAHVRQRALRIAFESRPRFFVNEVSRGKRGRA